MAGPSHLTCFLPYAVVHQPLPQVQSSQGQKRGGLEDQRHLHTSTLFSSSFSNPGNFFLGGGGTGGSGQVEVGTAPPPAKSPSETVSRMDQPYFLTSGQTAPDKKKFKFLSGRGITGLVCIVCCNRSGVLLLSTENTDNSWASTGGILLHKEAEGQTMHPTNDLKWDLLIFLDWISNSWQLDLQFLLQSSCKKLGF